MLMGIISALVGMAAGCVVVLAVLAFQGYALPPTERESSYWANVTLTLFAAVCVVIMATGLAGYYCG